MQGAGFPRLPALAILLVAAPLIPGIVTRTKSLMTGRRGAPIWQLYADLLKLAQRGAVYSATTTWVFRAAPVTLVATAVVAAMLLPLDGLHPVLGFPGDAVAFVGLLALGRFALVLAALDTGSSFEGMGASREVTFASMVEPGLFVALAALGAASPDFTLDALLGGSSAGGQAATYVPILIAASLFTLTLAECSRVPVDDPATHLELTMVHEVMVLDHGGPDLAMILYANALKLGIFASLIANVLVPAPRAGGITGMALLCAAFVALGVGVGLVESVMARLRLPKVPLYIAAGSATGLFALILLLR